MNYRHGFHAGNFADVVKHAVLARILVHLREKDTPFRVLDTHAGGGLYDLHGTEAARTGEWRGGIAAVLTSPPRGDAGAMLSPYLDAVAAVNAAPDGAPLTADTLRFYPGSPRIAAALMRPQDRLIACEFEPKAAASLVATLGRDRRAKAIAIDGWTALNAYLPPPERRGVVVIDPPYETDDFARLAEALPAALRKWATGTFLVWYPIKSRATADALAHRLVDFGIPKILRIVASVGAVTPGGPLASAGLLVVNPPWRLAGEAKAMLPALSDAFCRAGDPSTAKFRVDMVAP